MEYGQFHPVAKAMELPGDESVIRFKFIDLNKLGDCWRQVKGCNVDICLEDPGKEVDVYFTTDLRTTISCWMGGETYPAAVAGRRPKLVRALALTRNLQHWVADSIFTGIPPAREI